MVQIIEEPVVISQATKDASWLVLYDAFRGLEEREYCSESPSQKIYRNRRNQLVVDGVIVPEKGCE